MTFLSYRLIFIYSSKNLFIFLSLSTFINLSVFFYLSPSVFLPLAIFPLIFLSFSFIYVSVQLPLFIHCWLPLHRVFLPLYISLTLTLTSTAYVCFIMAFNGVSFFVILSCYVIMYISIRHSGAWNSNDTRVAKRMALLVITGLSR